MIRILVMYVFCGIPFILVSKHLNLDTMHQKHHYFNIEVGHSTSMFLDNGKSPNSLWANNPFLGLTFFKLSYSLKNNIVVSCDYKNYGNVDFDYETPGDIYHRYYRAYDFSVGYQFNIKKKQIRIQPYLSFSTRPYGYEIAFLSYYDPSLKYEPFFYVYSYKSKGVGAGISSLIAIKNRFTIGLDFQYNYYFEKKKLVGKVKKDWEDFNTNYKVNRQMFTPCIKVGLLI